MNRATGSVATITTEDTTGAGHGSQSEVAMGTRYDSWDGFCEEVFASAGESGRYLKMLYAAGGTAFMLVIISMLGFSPFMFITWLLAFLITPTGMIVGAVLGALAVPALKKIFSERRTLQPILKRLMEAEKPWYAIASSGSDVLSAERRAGIDEWFRWVTEGGLRPDTPQTTDEANKPSQSSPEVTMAVDIQKLMNEDFPAQMAKFPDQAKAIGGKFQLNITGEGGGEWFIDASDNGPSCRPGQGPAADLTITVAAEDFQKLQENPQNGMQLFFAGKLKLRGNQMLSMKLGKLFNLGQA